MLALAALDWAVVAAYGATVLAIGWAAARRQRSADEFFLGGRRLRWWMLAVSLVATSFSGVSLVGGTGFGYGRGQGLRWLQLQAGDLVALTIVCLLFLPFFSGLRLTTAYEYLERRFGVVARTVASALFIAQTVARGAVVLLVPAVALSEVLGWSIGSAILATTVAAIAYSASGGIAAVVWTDLIQMTVVVFSVLYCIVLVDLDVPGGIAAVLDHARGADQLEAFTFELDPGTYLNVSGAFLPWVVLTCSLYGTGQQAVQRFVACSDLGGARRAAFVSWAIGTFALALSLFLGVCLSAWVELAPGAPSLEGGDEALPSFIRARLPAGIAGLMLAAIFAASMSSLDSAIHSTATALLVDFVRRFSRTPPTPRAELFWARAATVGFGVLATGGALLAADLGQGILKTLVTWLGYFAGPLLSLFLLGMLTRRANEKGVLLGVGVAFGGVVLAILLRAPARLGVDPLWLAPFSALLTAGAGWAASLLWPPPDPLRIRDLVRGIPGPPD